MSQINTGAFYDTLRNNGIDLFTGVPDSLLKDLGACIYDRTPSERNIITANEGNAVGVAIGHHLSTGGYAAVYLQNSGLGNIVNPILSLAHPEVYSVPMLLVIGWRGEPGTSDEPQHTAQGRLTTAMLENLEIPFVVLDADAWQEQVGELLETMRSTSAPVALLVRKGTFEAHPFTRAEAPAGVELKREEALEEILTAIGPGAFVVSTTGMTSREVFEIRERRGEGHDRDFLTVGGMGHSSSIALGLALGTDAPVYCIDGDGGFLMHMGAAPVNASNASGNLRYIIINNGAHESVGGQPTVGFEIDIESILRGAGFAHVERVSGGADIAPAIGRLASTSRGALVIDTAQGSRPDLGRPTVAPRRNKLDMMERLREARQ